MAFYIELFNCNLTADQNMTNAQQKPSSTQQAFIQAQQSLASLALLGKKAYDGRYQRAVEAERLAKANLIAEQNFKNSCQI